MKDFRSWPRLPGEFYLKTALAAAPKLLGMALIHDSPQGLTGGLIIETEAYEGPHDRACHAYGGRRTKRTEVMFKEGGHTYVYFTYGMHYLFNVVVAPKEVPHVVLIRSIIPIAGEDLMLKRRGRFPLAIGPGRLCQAMGIRKEQNGLDMRLESSEIFIAIPPNPLKYRLRVTPRIGIENTGEARDYPWRFLASKVE